MPDRGGEPLVTIVIPTYERPAQLARCLESLASARRPGPIEVVVVDDGGTAELERRVEPFRASIAATVVRRANGGPGAARNTGVAHARGRYIVFLDDDCTVDAGALVAFVEGLQSAPGAVVGGRTVNGLERNAYAAASQAIVDAVYTFNNPDPADARFFATNNMAVERDAFLASGGFDERFQLAAEDREFCDRWRHRGGRLVYRADAVVQHAHDLTFTAFVRQHMGYGYSAYTYHQVRAHRGSGRMRDDLRFHAGLPARLVAAGRGLPAGAVARGAALAAVWQLANAAGWMGAAAADRGRRAVRQLPRCRSRPCLRPPEP